MTATGQPHGPGTPPGLGETFRLCWRMMSSQWSILWLAIILFAVSLVLDLIPMLWEWRPFLAHLKALSVSASHQRPPLLPVILAPGGPGPAVTILFDVVSFFAVMPYVQAAFVGGVLRAAADRVAVREFWRDGFRYFGRSYLATIGAIIVFIVMAAVGAIWSLIFFRLVRHGMGALIGAIGDATLFVYSVPTISLVYIGIFQSGWPGFSRALRMLLSRWGRMLALAYGMFFTLIAYAMIWAGLAYLAVRIYLAVHIARPPPDPLHMLIALSFAAILMLPATLAAELYCTGWFAIYYRRMNGMGLGPWAPADLQG